MGFDVGRVALDLAGTLYEAVYDDSAWERFLVELRDALAAQSITLLTQSEVPGLTRIALYSNPDDATIRLYNEHFARDNPLVERGVRKGILVPGRLACSYEVIPPDEWVKTQIYRAFFEPHGIHFCYGLTIDLGQGTIGTLSLDISRRRGLLTAAEEELLSLLYPHIQRAYRLASDLHRLAEDEAALLECIARSSLGLVLLDASGRAMTISRPAQELLHHNDGLRLDRHGRLVCAEAGDTTELAARIQTALSTAAGRGLSARGSMLVRRRSDKRPLSVLVTPLHAGAGDAFWSTPRAAVYICDPNVAIEPPEVAWKSMYGLTRSESRTVGALLSGLHVDEIADRFQLSKETIRHQLKQALQKTGTRSQSDLVRLLLTDASSLLARRRA